MGCTTIGRLIIMRAILICKVASFLHTSQIDSHHYVMFHGIGNRKENNDNPLNTIDQPASSPLELVLNIYRVNPIIQPLLNFIVTEDIAQQLTRRFGIQTTGVHIKGTAVIEYAEGSMKHWENPLYKDSGSTPEKILRNAAKQSQKMWTAHSLFEVLPFDGETQAELNPANAFNMCVNFEYIGEECNLIGTQEALWKYGLLWSDGIHCCRIDVFKYLEPLLKKEYFATRTVEL
jgi:hypothetical protein